MTIDLPLGSLMSRLKTPTPDLLFQEEDFLTTERTHWRQTDLGWDPGFHS